MKRFFLLISLLAITILFNSCQPFISFTYIRVTGNSKAELTSGFDFNIIENDSINSHYYISNDTLYVYGNSDVTVQIPDFSQITSIYADSSAQVFTRDNNIYNFNPVLTLTAEGNATITLNLTTSTLNVTVNDTATIIINSDTCNTVILNQTDFSNYWAYGLIASNYIINVSDAASANIYATNSISGNVTDNATVYYQGSPSQITVNVSGNAVFAPDSGAIVGYKAVK